MTARWLEIISKNHQGLGDHPSAQDFTVNEGEAADTRVAVEHPNLHLYCLDEASRQALFVDMPPDLDLTTVPFVHYTQSHQALRLLSIPYEAFLQLADELPKPELLIVIHNTARSGSTLLSRIFGSLDSVYSLSEPSPPVAAFVHTWDPHSDRVAELRSLFEGCMKFIFKPAVVGQASTFAVKPINQSMQIMDLYHAAFPNAKNLFSYRNAIDTMTSWYRLNVGRSGGPDRYSRSGMFAWYKQSWNLDLHPFTKYLDDDADAVPLTQLFTLWWLSSMERYVKAVETGIPLLGLRYEDLNTKRKEVLSRVFAYCGLPTSGVQQALEAFAKDSQEGTALERARPDEEPSRLSDEQVDEVVRVLARHPIINTSDFTAPGTLEL